MEKNILVYIETKENTPIKSSFEVLSKACELAEVLGTKAIGVVIGKNIDISKINSNGADILVGVEREEFNPREYAYVLEKIALEKDAGTIMMPATLDGKDIAAYLAYKLDTVVVTDVQKIEIEDLKFKFITPTYGSTVLTKSKVEDEKIKVLTIRSGSFEIVENSKEAELENIDIEKLEQKIFIKSVFEENQGEINLEDASIIVTCGRGASKGEGFKLVNQLSEILNSPISGTRPVIDDGILPKTSQIGQSGKIVSPKLYIGCGVSGSVQHISGIQSSNFIVSINKDEDAPIFKISDIGIVGECEKVLPIFNREIEKILNS